MSIPTFPSTMLVDSDPKEMSDQVNKALNDLLSKLNQLSTGVSGSIPSISGFITKAEAQALFAPLPQLPAGVGQITLTFGTVGASVNAPAGGMWQYTALVHATLNGSYLGGSGNTFFGICAGGSQAVAGQAGGYFDVFFWRIA